MCVMGLFALCALYFVKDDKNKRLSIDDHVWHTERKLYHFVEICDTVWKFLILTIYTFSVHLRI